MNIFNQISRSVYSPSYYKEVRRDTSGQSFRKYYRLTFWVALVGTIIATAILLPRLSALAKNGQEQVLKHYPAGLELTLKDGKIISNHASPVFVPLDAEATSSTLTFKNFLVIDTVTPFSLERFKAYQTVVWLTGDSLVAYDRTERITISPLARWPNMMINAAKVNTWSTRLGGFLPWLLPLLALAIFVLIHLAFAAYLIYFLVAALLVYLIARLKSVKLSYGEAYRVALAAGTLPVLLSALTFGGLFLPRFSFTIILLVIAFINLRGETKTT